MIEIVDAMTTLRPAGFAPAAGIALWQLGFRPFYLLASTFAAFSIALWAAQFNGLLGNAYLAGPLWHAHEMLFGFALAVIVGFLFTAGRNWTNRPTPSGPLLMILALWWLAARVLVLTPFAIAAAIVDATFAFAVAVALAIPFWAARNRRNYFFIALLTLLGLANVATHFARLGVLDMPAAYGIRVALDVVLFIMSVMGGRVIPMFTNNGVPGTGAERRSVVERLALGSTLALLAADALQAGGVVLAVLAALCGLAHAWRFALWRGWKTLGTPLVWILHAAYVWIPIHLALRSFAALGSVSESLASHALTVGAIGGLTIGMMTRTARGHTARPLKADRIDIACYGLVVLAAIVRVVVPLLVPAWLLAAISLSAMLWSCGFALYALHYGPWLVRTRLDGLPG